MSSFYSRTVFEHFRRPRNARVIEDADGEGRAVNEACSDVVQVFIKVGGEAGAETVADASFKAQGCVACIAAASMLTEMVNGKTLPDALDVDADALAEALGGIPPQKMQCSMISPDAFADAVRDYKDKSGA